MLTFSQQMRKTGCAKKAAEPFLVSHWAVGSTYDAAETNAVRDAPDIHVTVGALAGTIHVPIIRNTKALAAFDKVIVSKVAPSLDASADVKFAKKAKAEGSGWKAKALAASRA